MESPMDCISGRVVSFRILSSNLPITKKVDATTFGDHDESGDSESQVTFGLLCDLMWGHKRTARNSWQLKRPATQNFSAMPFNTLTEPTKYADGVKLASAFHSFLARSLMYSCCRRNNRHCEIQQSSLTTAGSVFQLISETREGPRHEQWGHLIVRFIFWWSFRTR